MIHPEAPASPEGPVSPDRPPPELGGGDAWLFISYSRTTSPAAREVTDSLEAAGYQVWIDEESITPASDWRQRISVGIEGARAIVLIISKAFLASPNCDRELVEARQLGKRLIPVLVEPIEIDGLPAPLPDLDLIIAYDRDLTAAVAEIVEAIETDVEWLDEHTRLLQAALQWADEPDDRSLLLRGNALRATRGAVDVAGGRSPVVTALQRTFLEASEANRVRALRLGWGVAVVGAVIIALAVVAAVERAAAVEARTGAEAQRIAIDGEALVDTQLDLALRLMLAAWSWDPGLATESALLTGLTSGPGLRATLVVSPDGLDEAVFTTQDRSMIAIDESGEAFMWAESGEVSKLGSGVDAVTTNSGTTGSGMTAWASSDTIVFTGDVTARCPAPGRVLALVTTGARALVSVPEGGGSTVMAIDPQDCDTATIATSEGRVAAFARSESGQVAWGTQAGDVTVVDDESHEISSHEFAGAGVTALEFDGGLLAVGLDNGALAIVDGAGVDGAGRTEVAGAHRGAVTAIAFVDEGVVTAGLDGWIRIWDRSSGRRRLELTNVGPDGQPAAILDVTQWAPGGLVTVDVAGRAQGWDLTDGSPLVQRVGEASGIEAMVAIDGRYWAAGAGGEVAGDLDPATAESIGLDQVDVTGQGMTSVAVRGGITVWSDGVSARGLDRVWPVEARAISTDGKVVFAATAAGQVIALTESGERVAFDDHIGTVDALDISPDGALVASGGDDRTIKVWNAVTQDVVHTFVGHTDRVLDLDFSPDGARLVSVGEDDRMIVWDLAANAMVGEPMRHPTVGRITQVEHVGPTTVLTAGPAVYRWELGAEHVVSVACRLASPRMLTDAERAQYLGDADPSDPCGEP